MTRVKPSLGSDLARTPDDDVSRSRELGALYRFTDRLFRARSIADVHDAALNAIIEALACDRASILAFDEAGAMRFVAWRGLSDAYRQAVDGHSPWTRGQTDAEPLVIEDIANTDEPEELKRAIMGEGIRGIAFVPLTQAGAVIGKFMVYYDQPRRLTDREVELAVTIGRQLSFSLERLRADDALRRERELLQSVIDRIPVMISVHEPPHLTMLRLNREFEQVLGWTAESARGVSLLEEMLPDPGLCDKFRRFMERSPESWLDVPMVSREGRLVDTSWASIRLSDQTQVGIGLDITDRKRRESELKRYGERMAVLNRITRTLSSNLDLSLIVQEATDSATRLTGAQFGAFFYNVTDGQGERYRLFALCGAPHAAFRGFELPRITPLLEPTFRGEAVIRIDDVRADPRFGRNAPHFGMPVGHLPVVSYLAVPVVSRTGDVHGGMFFGHADAGVFTEDDEILVTAIAAQTAIAMDTANLLLSQEREIEQRRTAEYSAQRLAAIVESSEDAIYGANLYGIITSWNAGAVRLLGYDAEEVIGQPLELLTPTARQDAERDMLATIRAGNRVAPFETERRDKAGLDVPVSLSISPVLDTQGRIIGASTIARDIRERRRAEMQRETLLREMDHRIKNLFTLAGGLVSHSAREAKDIGALVADVGQRLQALAQAHAMVLAGPHGGECVSLHALVETVLAPYQDGAGRVTITGPDVELDAAAVTAMALLLHEFATNAAKYGALSTPGGRILIDCSETTDRFTLLWTEIGGPKLTPQSGPEGFGTKLAQGTAASQLDGAFERELRPDGLVIRLTAAKARLCSQPEATN